ncbi:MAG: DEAD/DEAH box helicase [Henriciella sp.]|nr:DEAD/DEAH box helicase [Henriciella sp.]
MTTFTDLGLHKLLMKAINAQGYESPTPIQAQAIPLLLEGRDLLGIAQTGTGKTAAFALPTLDYLLEHQELRKPKKPRVLVLAPTRELASQIADSFREYSEFMDCVTQTVFGGVKINKQIRDLQKGTHVLVATPGRLLDLMGQGALFLSDVEILILDEADQMLDMGFINDIKKILVNVPKDRQTLLFSATMPKSISELAGQYLSDPVKVSVAPQSTTAERVNQGVIHIAAGDKLKLLGAVLKGQEIERALVFTRTKHGADKVVRKLLQDGVQAAAIHGNKSQPQRMKALAAFKKGTTPVLVATDIAARGIDVDGVSHVINFEMPNVAEQYVHRIGRTARAGKDGLAISFVAADELYYLREVEKVVRQSIPVIEVPEDCGVTAMPTPDPSGRPVKPKGPGGGRGGNRGGGHQGGGRSGGQRQRSGGQGGGGHRRSGGGNRNRSRSKVSA